MISYKMADTETDPTGETSSLPTFHSSGTVDNGIEGDIHIPVPSDDEDELNTLDEPVSETLVCIIYSIVVIFKPFRPSHLKNSNKYKNDLN